MLMTSLPGGGRLTYLERADWDNSGAPRLGHIIDPARFRHLVIHHTVNIAAPDDSDLVDERRAMRSLRTIRPDLGLDVPYSFVVFRQTDPRSVVVAEGRGWERTGAHTRGHNSSAYGVACYGDYRTDPMTDGMVAGVRWVGEHIEGDAAPTTSHRDYKATECPGGNVVARLAELQPPFTTSEDPAMTPETVARLAEVEAIILLSMRPAELVDNAYNTILGRRPDKTGRQFWIDYLTGGGSVAEMVDLFRMSPEATST